MRAGAGAGRARVLTLTLTLILTLTLTLTLTRCWPTADRANTKLVIEGARSAGLGGTALKLPSTVADPPAPPSAPTPPVPSGRCGPLFGGAKCDCSRGEDGGLALWCSPASWLGLG